MSKGVPITPGGHCRENPRSVPIWLLLSTFLIINFPFPLSKRPCYCVSTCFHIFLCTLVHRLLFFLSTAGNVVPTLECNERLFSSISHALIFVDVFSDSFLLFPVLLYWLLAFLNHIQFCMNDIGSLLPGAFVYTAWYYWTDTTSFSQKACWESSMSNGSKRFRFCSLYLLD